MTGSDRAPGSDAAASGLRYVSPDGPGIRRRRAGRGFTYLDDRGRRIRSAREVARIRAIAIPPAWTDVWICPEPNGHVQAVGRDARGRRQYRYHPRFRARRDAGKFERLVRFGERLPRIRRRARRDLGSPGLSREKVLAAVVSLLDATPLRIGNPSYTRLNRSFGVSTLRDRHATVTGSTIRFRFRGKGGRTEERDLVDRRLADIVRRCQDLPGQALFQYVGDDGEPSAVSSEDVNAYLREAAGSENVSAKDFRTWVATVLAFRALRDAPTDAGDPGRSRIATALRLTAEELGNTVAVTRDAYVHPGVIAAFDRAADAGEEARRRTRDGRPDRRDERELLALLRRAERSRRTASTTRAARRSQVRSRRVAKRSRRPAG